MPLCPTGLAPPAFTAPCRNQTGDVPQTEATAVPARSRGIWRILPIGSRKPRTSLSLFLQFCRSAETREPISHVRKPRVVSVARREHGVGGWPAYADVGVIPCDADLGPGVVEIRTLVLDLSRLAEDDEPVRETGRHETLLEVLG